MAISLKNKLDKLSIEKRAFIGGEFVNAHLGKTFSKEVSSTAETIDGIACCDDDDLNKAVSIAKKTFSSRVWADTTPAHRKQVLLKLADLMEQHREELALLDTYETGRSFKNYFFDSIPKAIEVVRWFAESIDKLSDKAISPSDENFATIVRVPLGVVGCITPWNDPLVPAMWKMTPALLMGNSVIMKPAEQSTLSILKVAGLAKQSGIPDGVLNVLPGYGEVVGKKLALHPDVDGIFFTGSSEVGKLILQYSGQSNMKKVGLECGGKSPYIVSENCSDIKAAAECLAASIFYNQGQICSAPTRVFVSKKIANEFTNLLKVAAEKFSPADPFSPDSEVGCMISRDQKKKVESYIQKAIDSGANVHSTKTKGTAPQSGVFVSPTIITNIDLKSSVFSEEIFGPVVCLTTFDTFQEAITKANDSKYGLAAAIWTDNINEAYQAGRLLESGIVHINSYGEDDMRVPFGGFKESGNGKEKSLYAFDEYSHLKTIWMRLKSYKTL